MTDDELSTMKATPGLYIVNIAHPLFANDGLVVASIGGKLYGMVADNELSDDGWGEHAKLERCILQGGVHRFQA